MKGWICTFIILIALLGIIISQINRDPHFVPYAKTNQPLPQILKNKIPKQPVIIHFWATWCIVCQAEHPDLMNLTHAHKIMWVGVAFKDSISKASKWLKLQGNPFDKLIFDNDGSIAISMGVYGTPETFLIDKNHKIILRHTGAINKKVWEQKFLPKLKEAL